MLFLRVIHVSSESDMHRCYSCEKTRRLRFPFRHHQSECLILSTLDTQYSLTVAVVVEI